MDKVIQLEIEESVLEQIDEAAAKIGVSRTTFMRAAIKHALHRHYLKDLGEEDEANSFRLWMVDDDVDDSWLGRRDWDDPSDGPENSRSN